MFPSTLRWVVQTMCHLLRSVHVNDKDINDILTDMIFTNFICPAVVSPDLYGICDAPISEHARLNLIQIGQILQMFALMQHEDIDPKYVELISMFDRNTVSDLMNELLETDNNDIRVSSMAIPHQNDFGRGHVLVTQNELNTFVNFLRTVLDNDELTISGEDRRKLGKILEQLPSKFETAVNGGDQHINVTIGVHAAESQSKTKQLINLGKSTKNKLAKTISMNVGVSHADTDEFAGNANFNGSVGLNNNVYHGDDNENVLLIPIAISEENKFQLLTEQEVLNMNNISNEIGEPVLTEQNVGTLDKTNNVTFDDELGAVLPARKHTRFSLSQDDQSIGNSDKCSDLEVVSEAPSNSNHSVTSSLELEENDQNLNDNLSDMVSANVSGRGTPNISDNGRDTPSSQVTEGETAQIPTPQMAKILNKARSDIDDKFCKFEIKKLVEGVDETISIISDTWSTDVLASDSEPVENERNFSTPLIPSAVVLPGDNNFNSLTNPVSQLRANYLDASDTRSESAWSTDVLDPSDGCDSEKMTEVDTDDNQSIAKSDTTDANRSDDPIPDLIPVANQRAPDSPFFSPRNRAPDSPMFAPRTNSHFDDRRLGNQSPRFPNEDYARFGVAASPSAVAHGRHSSNKRYSDNAYRNYRSANGESFERDPFLGAANSSMRRQNSAESSISNQSSTLDDAAALNDKSKMSTDSKSNFPRQYDFLRDNNHGARLTSENVVKSSTDIINPFADEELGAQGANPGDLLRHANTNHANYSDDLVERRRISAEQMTEQRNASFDGRRNGISFSNVSTGSNSITASTVKRFAKSLNYENHEIIAKTQTSSMQLMSSSATDDDKNKQQDEYLLAQKTMAMSLKETPNGFGQSSSTESNGEVFPAEASTSNDDSLAKAAAKYTGAIPKSISFDATADKTGAGRKLGESPGTSPFHQVNPIGRQNGNGFFSKIRKGFRRNTKLPRATFEDYTAPTESATNAPAGTSLFVNSSQKSSLENGTFNDSEDILEKYRRKISSSSEATTSDSIGINSNERKSLMNTDEHRLSGLLNDESVYLYTKTKQKLRLVLSTTDLHTADFRHTNVSDRSLRPPC